MENPRVKNREKPTITPYMPHFTTDVAARVVTDTSWAESNLRGNGRLGDTAILVCIGKGVDFHYTPGLAKHSGTVLSEWLAPTYV